MKRNPRLHFLERTER